jgi:hypothetical protein
MLAKLVNLWHTTEWEKIPEHHALGMRHAFVLAIQIEFQKEV